MNDESTAILRRTAPRYGCVGNAEIVLPGRGLHYAGQIGDLSVGGCFIEARCRMERGTAVEIWMNARGQPLRMAANLMVQRENGAGFRFQSVTPRKLDQIKILIAELAEDEARRKASVPAAEGDVGAGAGSGEVRGQQDHPSAVLTEVAQGSPAESLQPQAQPFEKRQSEEPPKEAPGTARKASPPGVRARLGLWLVRLGLRLNEGSGAEDGEERLLAIARPKRSALP
ncbi:MAG TPA: PilZ domain-containing protein [Acidobacteriaceae bacterium]|jgi:hypothetical protein|nr:PilZ domain-containing protein [Acidobacteriaceae bacterium]